MNLHFDFQVDAEDADNILRTIRDESLRCNELGVFGVLDGRCTEAEATWYRGRAEYLRELISKMHFSQV